MLAFGSLADAWVLPIRKLKCQDACVALILSAQDTFPAEIIEMIYLDVWESRRDPCWDRSVKISPEPARKEATPDMNATEKETTRPVHEPSGFLHGLWAWMHDIIEA